MPQAAHSPTTFMGPPIPAAAPPTYREAVRDLLEAAIEQALLVLDLMDGDPDLEDQCEDEGAQCDDEGVLERW